MIRIQCADGKVPLRYFILFGATSSCKLLLAVHLHVVNFHCHCGHTVTQLIRNLSQMTCYNCIAHPI